MFRYLLVFLISSALACADPISLSSLEKQIALDLQRLHIPQTEWVNSKKHILDVAIIGGGMSGLTAAFALMREGIVNIKIFDENICGKEGVWEKCARMKQLRSSKFFLGSDLGIYNLSFEAWYKASFSEEEWNKLKTAPTKVWNDYLHWYREVLNLPVQNDMQLKSICPREDGLELVFNDEQAWLARKVVLATGRDGFGRGEIPDFMQEVPKRFYAHTNEEIDQEDLKGKRVAIVGAGASAFDAAAFALEGGATQVDLFARRKELPSVSRFSRFFSPGMLHGFCELPDAVRYSLFANALECGIPPPQSALERVRHYDNFHVHLDSSIQKVSFSQSGIALQTAQGNFSADFVILATGYAVDGRYRQELQPHLEAILLWQDKVSLEADGRTAKLGSFPYLGSHFQFLEKTAGSAPYLKDIYCFNYGAFLSHGLLSGDIPGISTGARRLAQGIAADFLVEDLEYFLKSMEDFRDALFDPADYPFLRKDDSSFLCH